MILDVDKWKEIEKKPKELRGIKKYILNYFLGNLSKERSDEIKRIAKEYDCKIINMMDESGKFYGLGPREFLYLEKNAFLICTDSFHSCVFAVLYNRPFIIFDREDKKEDNMNSRIDTLISKLELEDRKYCGKITEKNLKHDYSKAYEILNIERKKSIRFLENALSHESHEVGKK